MSLYARDPQPPVLAGVLENKKFVQVGFVVLAGSGLLRVVEHIVDYGLHFNELEFSGGEWAWIGVSNLVTVGFAILFLRYFSKGSGQNSIWILLACTAAGWIAFITWYLSAFVIQGVPPAFTLVADWLEMPGYTGTPLGCIFGPFLQGSRYSYHVYLTYILNADYVIKLSFFGVCMARNRQIRQQGAEQVQAAIARGLGMSAGAR